MTAVDPPFWVRPADLVLDAGRPILTGRDDAEPVVFVADVHIIEAWANGCEVDVLHWFDRHDGRAVAVCTLKEALRCEL